MAETQAFGRFFKTIACIASQRCNLMNFCVLVTEPLPEIEFGLKILEDTEIEIKDRFVAEILGDDIRDIDAVVAGDSLVTRRTLKGANKLKVIGRFGAGYDRVDIEACAEKGIVVFNAPRLSGQSVAEHTFGMIIAVAKNFRYMDQLVREGRWSDKPTRVGTELHRKTLGIVGLGNIGYLVARLAKAFEMRILAHDPYVQTERAREVGAEIVDLNTLLKNADFITLHIPLTDQTRGLIGEDEFALMKKDAILINMARGGVVEENALYQALRERRIAGAGIDVLENEPVTKHPLFQLDNILLTPHIGAWTKEAFRRVALFVCENILKVKRGKLPENVVNPKAIQAATWLQR